MGRNVWSLVPAILAFAWLVFGTTTLVALAGLPAPSEYVERPAAGTVVVRVEEIYLVQEPSACGSGDHGRSAPAIELASRVPPSLMRDAGRCTESSPHGKGALSTSR